MEPINDYLFKVQEREIPRLPDGMRGKEKESSGYTDTRPRDWTEGEIAFIKKMKADGYSLKDIATATGRTETSVSIKFKRLGKAGVGTIQLTRARSTKRTRRSTNTGTSRTYLTPTAELNRSGLTKWEAKS